VTFADDLLEIAHLRGRGSSSNTTSVAFAPHDSDLFRLSADVHARVRSIALAEHTRDNRRAGRLDELHQLVEMFFGDRAGEIGKDEACGDDGLHVAFGENNDTTARVPVGS
jgi:hypothetical protein